ncbi:MAG: DUF2339 domain-containing protein [Blastocatellia bacterium]
MTDEDPAQDRIAQLIERINQMDEMLRQQAWRLYHIEQRLGLAPPRLQPPPMPPHTSPPAVAREPFAPPPAPDAASPREPVRDEMRTQPPPTTFGQAPPVRPPSPPPPQPPYQVTPPPFGQPRPRPRGDLEARIGGNWFQRIGVVAFALGIAFFLKYAYDNEWIGKSGALWICIVIGVGFLAGGERLRPRYHNYAYGLTGLGIAILYTCFYAAYGQLQLWSVAPAFIGMVLVTAMASLLAARYNALPIAILGLIGGFLTPLVLSTGHDNEAGLFSYIALLDLGVLALAYSKQWRSLNYLAFGATVLLFLGWADRWYAPEKLGPTLGFLTLFFAIFALLAVLYNVVNRRQTRWLDLAMVFANALLYFGASYGLLESEYRARLGLFALLVSAFYLALGYFTYQRDREDRLLLYTFCGLAILFAVLAVPIQFHQHWVTMGWAIEGAILTWIGLRLDDRVSRAGAAIIFLISASHWLLFDAMDVVVQANQTFTPLWNRRALSCAVLIACLLLAAAFYKRLGERIEPSERTTLGGLFLLGANALAIVLLSLDINAYFEQRIRQANQSARAQLEQLDSTRQLTLTILWVVYAMVMLVVGLRRRLKPVHIAGLALLALAIVKALAIDLGYYDAVWHQPFANQTFATFITLIAATGLSAWLYARADQLEEGERRALFVVMLIAANALAVLALSAEAVGYFSARLAEAGVTAERERDLRLAQQLWLTVVWAVYGGVLLTVGLARRQALLRVMALVLLAMTIVKVYVLDIWSLARLYRIVALILLGVILLLVSFLYQPLRRRLAEAENDAEQ